MRDPDVEALASDPNARVMVFIDGQNLYNRCRAYFGNPMCHPHLLAEYLTGPRTTHRPRARFYTGRPSPNEPGEGTKLRNLDRRLAVMRKQGVDVVTRRLRYHWDWGHQEELPKPSASATPQTVEVTPYRRPHEKGIDLVLGLDVVEFVLTGHCDVAIVVSLDTDLHEIPQAVKHLKRLIDRPVRLEAAVPVPPNARRPKVLTAFDYTHQIDRDVFDLVEDHTYYATDGAWTSPTVPEALAEVKGTD